MKNKSGKLLNLILHLVPVLCVFVLWAGCAKAVDSEYILPSVWATFSALIILLGKSEFYFAHSRFDIGFGKFSFVFKFSEGIFEFFT